MQKTFPLITREPDDALAFLSHPLAQIGLPAGCVSARQFISHVMRVASVLPPHRHAINVCENRYLFLVGFCAAIVRGTINLLPQNKNIATQQQLCDEYSDSIIIHDGGEISSAQAALNMLSVPINSTSDNKTDIPLINDDFLACISFTSGSTGKSKPNIKYWRTLHRSSMINYAFMIPDCDETLYQLATMPAQHMWGLETSALLPLFTNLCMCDAKPLFPRDIIDIFARLPSPKQLVSTPVHLRALCADMNASVCAHSVLCATSPLTVELAEEVELKFNAPLREVYGCSEVGSMAVRRTAQQQTWLKFEGIEFVQDGNVTTASAEHLPGPTVLQDFIEFLEPGRFVLSGRASDLIKIAGKRGSLFDINQTLLTFNGLEDGIVIQPESHSMVSRLVAIVSLKPGVDKVTLLKFLQSKLDSAFVPRPIYVVDSLPREPNGKLLRQNVETLHASLKKKQRR